MSTSPGVRFPDQLVYRGYSAPSRIEASVYDLEVDGMIPPELNGTYFRACADPQYPPFHGTDIFINGDGMIHKIEISSIKMDTGDQIACFGTPMICGCVRMSSPGWPEHRPNLEPFVLAWIEGNFGPGKFWGNGPRLR